MGDEAAKKEAERVAALQAAFAEGAALTNAGKTDEAIAKFNEVIAIYPKCARVLQQHRRDPFAQAGLGQG